MKNCNWVREDPMLNLGRYVHGKPLPGNIYFKVVDLLNLKSYVIETIMSTPYSFCRDLVDVSVKRIKSMNGFLLLEASKNIVLGLMKCIKRIPIKASLFTPFTYHFTQAMLVFNQDRLPIDIARLHSENDKREISKYIGYRVKTIFKILVETIKFNTSEDNFALYPMYRLKSLRETSAVDLSNPMHKKSFDIIIHKCMDLCNFSISTWLGWYEIEVVEEDTNLQAAIGELCYDLCQFIDNGIVKYQLLLDFNPILRNISIERINYDDVDVNNIDEMIDRVQKSTKHVNGWIKKMIENNNVFIHPNAIQVLDDSMNRIDYNCFKRIVEQSMEHFKRGGIVLDSLANAIYKGIEHLDLEDKMCILKHVLANYADHSFYLSKDFDETLLYVTKNETNESCDKNVSFQIFIFSILKSFY